MNLLTKRMKEMVQPSFASSELYDILNKIKSNVVSLEDSNPQKYLWLGEIKDITIDPKNSHLLLLAINDISSLWNLVIHDKYLFGIDKNDSDIISIIPLYYINNLVESRYEFVPCTVYLHGKYLEPDFIIASKSKAIINEMLSILPMMNPKLKNSAKVVGESDEPETDIDYQEKMEKLIDRKDPEGLAGLADKYSSDINMDEKVQVNYEPENPDIALTSTPVSEGVDPFIIATYMNKIKKSDVEIVQNADEDDAKLDIFKDSEDDDNLEPVKLDDLYNLNEALTAKERKKLKDEDFGIPSLRKYPLHDPAHVYAAIKFFNYIDKEHEKELANNIIKAANKFDIPIEPGEKNKLRKYVKVTLKKKQAPPKKDDIFNVANKEMNEAIAILETANNMSLYDYLNSVILPQYSKADKGHDQKHILSVLDKSLKLANLVGVRNKINTAIVHATAIYHDIGLIYGDRKIHHLTSHDVVMKDQNLKKWFSPSEIEIIAIACKEHRASNREPVTSIYSKILADGDTICDGMDLSHDIIRAYEYRIGKGYTDSILIKNEIYDFLSERYGKSGRPGLSFHLTETYKLIEKELKKGQAILNNRVTFDKLYDKTISEYLSNINNEAAMIRKMKAKPEIISANMKIKLDDKEIVPVYIILTKSDTTMGNVIRKVTGEKYNHASIAVDHNLINLYSFARRDDGTGGLVIESTKNGRLAELMNAENPTEYALYVTFLSYPKYIKLETKLNSMVKDLRKYKYNMLQLLKLPLGLENRNQRAMICSEFVGTLLKEGDETLITKAPSLLTPGELVNPKFYFVSDGLLKEYDPKNTKKHINQLVESNRIYTFLTESGIGNYMLYNQAFNINRSSSNIVDVIDNFFPTTLVEFDALLSMTNGGTFFDIHKDGYEQGILNYNPDSNFYKVDLSNDENHMLFSYTIQSLIKRLFINRELFTKKMTSDQLEKTMTLIALWTDKVRYYYDQMKVTNDELGILNYKQRLLDIGWAPSNDPFDNESNEFLKVALMVELGVIWDPVPEARLDYGKIDNKVNSLLDDDIFLTVDRRFPIFDEGSLLLAAYQYSLLEEFEKSDFMEKWLNRYEYLGCSFKLSPNLLFSKDLPKDFKSLVQEEEYSMLNEAIKTKSYNIELADDGSLNIKTKLTSDIETMYRDSLRNIKIYKQNDNIEGLKKEAVILKYMIDLITNTYGNQKINKKINNPAKYKQMMDLRAIMINTWSQTVTYIVSKEPDFDFTEHYNKSDYGKDIKLTQNELVTSAKLIGAVFKSLTGL